MRAVWLLPSLAGLSRRRIASGVSEASRFSCTECPDVLGVYDYAGPTRSSRSRCWSCCLPPFGQRRHPDCRFSKLDTQPIFSPVYASLDVSQHPAQNSGPSGSLLLSRKALSSSIPCRFSPAHPNLLFYPAAVLTVYVPTGSPRSHMRSEPASGGESSGSGSCRCGQVRLSGLIVSG